MIALVKEGELDTEFGRKKNKGQRGQMHIQKVSLILLSCTETYKEVHYTMRQNKDYRFS